jgi:hypothetical protein
MAQRQQLHNILKTILGSDNVYFQPPESVKMKYPAIVYRRNQDYVDFADNKPYKRCVRYQVTVIDQNPDSVIPGKIAELPLCKFDRAFAADNLNHDVFNIFF